MQICDIYIYPIKSFRAIKLNECEIDKNGFVNDRKWMLVDENNRFLSQREVAEMALFCVELKNENLFIYHKNKPEKNILIPTKTPKNKAINVKIWNDECFAIPYDDEFNKWFSNILNRKCTFVKMPETTLRKVDTDYALNNETINFSDGYPFMLIGSASLEKLNEMLQSKAEMLQFRPNIVVKTNSPFEEDFWKNFSVKNINFTIAKPCARCIVPSINIDSAIKNPEVIDALTTFRKINNKILFGQNILHKGIGKICVGDEIIFPFQ